MRPTLGFLKFKFLTALQFRSEVVVWLFLDFIPYLSLFFIFFALFQGHDTIRGLTLTQTLEYFFFVSIIQSVTGVHFEGWRTEEIRLGKIDFFLIRPFSYLKEIVLSDIAAKILFLLLFTPLYVCFFLTVQAFFQLQLFSHISLQTALLFCVFLLIGYGMQLSIALIIVFLSFWFESAEGLQHFKWVILTIFSGGMVPTEFMPQWMQTLVQQLPLRYLVEYPILLIQGKTVLTTTDIAVVATSIVVAWSVVFALKHAGIAKYSSVGG